jgi:hypothetical protein
MMIFSGFLVELVTVFHWLSWIQWISAFRFASNILTINEFRTLTLCHTTNMTIECSLPGKKVLEEWGIDYANGWDMWKYFFALTCMTIVFLMLSCIQLVRMKKTK